MKLSFAAAALLLLAGPALPPAAPASRPSPFAAHDATARALLAKMTLDEKIGQMTQAEQHQLQDEADIETYFLGSLLSGGDSDPKTNSLQDWTDMYDRYQARALKTRLKIPILYGVDAVHGHNNVLGAVMRLRTASRSSSGHRGSFEPWRNSTGVVSASRTLSRRAPVAPERRDSSMVQKRQRSDSA